MRPRNPIHPGATLLEEFLVPVGLSQRAFAKRLGWTVAKLNELIKGKQGITADSALDLAADLGTSPEVWLNLQMRFDFKWAAVDFPQNLDKMSKCE
jgi:addiction module HigA family antidote